MRILKFVVVLLTAFQLIVNPASAMTGNKGKTVHYLALGDSLAAGMIETGGMGKGYPDFLAQYLKEADLLASYNKGFAVSGYTTTDVLTELKSDVKKFSTETAKEVSLLDEVKKADIITISVGANDVLKFVKPNKEGSMQFDVQQIIQAFGQIATNYDKILKRIAQLNPTADVFIMGYYNPFAYVKEYTGQINLLVSMMDRTMMQVAEKNDAYFVEIADVIASNIELYLPNPQNIHLSEAGYEVVAQTFAAKVIADASLIRGVTDAAASSEDKVTIYRDAGYAGKSFILPEGYSDYRDWNGFGNDTLTSIKVPDGYTVTLYDHINRGGKSVTLTSNATYGQLNGLHDMVSSAFVEKVSSNTF